jgi:hypothetical protein
VRQLNILGYTVEGGDRETGFVRARKQTSGLGTALLTGKNYHDVLTAAVFEDPTSGQTTLRITAARAEENAIGMFGGNERGIAPSDAGKADANALLRECGATDIVGPVGRTNYESPIQTELLAYPGYVSMIVAD